MEPVYVKRFIKSEADLPKEHGIYLTEFGWLQFNGKWKYPQRANVAYTRDVDWWLEPKEIPIEEQIEKEFPCDIRTLAKELKIPEELMSSEMSEALKSIQESNLNKQLGVNWLLSKLK